MPGTPDLLALAERAAAAAGPGALARAVRGRSLTWRTGAPPSFGERVCVEVLAVRDGAPGLAVASGAADEDALASAAERAQVAAAAAARAGVRHPGAPAPEPARPHAGWDAATAALDPAVAERAFAQVAERAAASGLQARAAWSSGAVEIAIAAGTGLGATDAITDARLDVVVSGDRAGPARRGVASESAGAAAALDPARAFERAAARLGSDGPVAPPHGALAVVLGPDAVAVLLDALGRLAFNGLAVAQGHSALAGRLGTRVAAATINLSDTPRFGLTLPRAYDAEGVPKAPIPLIQDGVAHRVVHDLRSAAAAGGNARSTGHALLPGGAPGGPEPRNLVLVGGGAADEAELAAPVAHGLLLTRLEGLQVLDAPATLITAVAPDGAFLVRDGAIGATVGPVRLTDVALRVLAATEALTASPRLVGMAAAAAGRYAYGVVCPALRATDVPVSPA